MTTQKLIERIDDIIDGVEMDSFTIENLEALKRTIVSEGITN